MPVCFSNCANSSSNRRECSRLLIMFRAFCWSYSTSPGFKKDWLTSCVLCASRILNSVILFLLPGTLILHIVSDLEDRAAISSAPSCHSQWYPYVESVPLCVHSVGEVRLHVFRCLCPLFSLTSNCLRTDVGTHLSLLFPVDLAQYLGQEWQVLDIGGEGPGQSYQLVVTPWNAKLKRVTRLGPAQVATSVLCACISAVLTLADSSPP
jgi:hypothetical protein